MLPSELSDGSAGKKIYPGRSTPKVLHEEFKKTLKGLGAMQYDLWLPETHSLPSVIQPGEQIRGIVYGRYKKQNGTDIGRGALVSTNQRVLLLDKKPLYIRCDELRYEVVSGVSYTKAGIAGTVTLHTRLGDINVRTFNQKCAHAFVSAIEGSIMREGGGSYDGS